jgi:pilus assembly protein Flp/PilA
LTASPQGVRFTHPRGGQAFVAGHHASGQGPYREVKNAVRFQLQDFVARFRPPADEDGQGLAEYALILALIAIVAIVALIYLGGQVSDKLSAVGVAI